MKYIFIISIIFILGCKPYTGIQRDHKELDNTIEETLNKL